MTTPAGRVDDNRRRRAFATARLGLGIVLLVVLAGGLRLTDAGSLRTPFVTDRGPALHQTGARPSAAREEASLSAEDPERAGFRADVWRHEDQAAPALPHLRARAESAEAVAVLHRTEREHAAVLPRANEIGPAPPPTAPATVTWDHPTHQSVEQPLAASVVSGVWDAQQLRDATAALQQEACTALAVAAVIVALAGVAGWLIGRGYGWAGSERVRALARPPSRLGVTDRSTPRPPMGDDEVAELAAINTPLAAALAEQHARLEAIIATLTTVNEAASAITSTLHLDQLVGVIFDQLARVVAVEKAAIYLDEGDGPRCLAGRNWTAADDAEVGALRANAASPVVGCFLVQRGKRPTGSGALTADRAMVIQPLTVRDRHVGMLVVVSPHDAPFDDDDCRSIALIGAHVAVALENARLFAARKQAGIAEERSRLAREIHDTLAQGLSAIVLHLETADAWFERAAGSGNDEARQHVRRACELARANLEEARRSVHDLRAASLAGLDLPRALHRLAQTTTEATGIRVRCEVDNGLSRLPARIETGLYRIAQEALTNAVRHAAPTEVTIRLVAEGSTIQLSLADDGCGFDPNAVGAATEGDGFGLVGMRERAALLGGSLEIESRPHAGTQVIVRVPREDDPPAAPLTRRTD